MMCVNIFPLGKKVLCKNSCRVFSLCDIQPAAPSFSKDSCQGKPYLSWLHTWARCWGFSGLQDRGGKSFCISCVLTPSLKLWRFITSQQYHKLAWNYPLRRTHWPCGWVPFARSGCLCATSFLPPPPAILRKVSLAGVTIHLLKPAAHRQLCFYFKCSLFSIDIYEISACSI